MTVLVLGVLLWAFAHLAKRVFPGFHAAMKGSERPMVTAMLILAVVLMVVGYRNADGAVWWGISPATKGINNLMVLAAFYLFASSGIKNRVGTRFRHPQLTGFSLWAAAHLMVNGDLPSLVLFGGLLLWALAEIVVINAHSPGWRPATTPVPARKEIMAVVAALVAFGVVAMIHRALGYNPF